MHNPFSHTINNAKHFDVISYNKARRRIEAGTHTGWKWWKFRKTILMADPLCNDCGRVGEHVHHLVPRHIAPERMYDVSNCVTLCKVCHDRRHGIA
jgi:5-methylcytosine-specific restriction endonuclease McrA